MYSMSRISFKLNFLCGWKHCFRFLYKVRTPMLGLKCMNHGSQATVTMEYGAFSLSSQSPLFCGRTRTAQVNKSKLSLTRVHVL